MSDDAMYAPKYVRIIETLRRRIEDGTYPVGSQIPSETALGREFGAARPTVVRALNEMQLLGELQREHGRGTFVKARPSSRASDSNRPGLAVLDRQETGASVRVLETGRRPAPNQVALLLGLAESAPIHLRRYVGLYDSIASELVSLWAPLDVARTAGLDQEGPLTVPVRELLAAAGKERLSRVRERLRARRATEEERAALELGEGEPVLSVLGSVEDSSGRTVLVVEVTLPGSLHVLEDSYTL
ncbi:GntR family transcriptional regulator [Actinomadura decatromicini]|uniref:GntR family transcriptional regulator n=1 Tax=Actinomadura decatromicini TaxID=2604572 RepID=A0A5D3FVX7_9ACTN|nr:GntR family transcriptional regulator [Actinomadura decatromicini]TYK52383.1 GntR family transcriptional regulator [Actinomadura decatromicini]